MSKAKKPGTDLAALKARLAKKTKGGPDVPPPGEVAAPPQPDVPPPGQVAQHEIPAPGEQLPPPPAAEMIPAPGEQLPPPTPDIPPPGQVAVPDVPPPAHQPAPAPMQMAAPAPRPAPMPQAEDDPFGGSMGGGFDPDAGIIDTGGDVTPRGSKGLVIFAALLAAGLGAVGGFIGNKIVSKRELIASGQSKGEAMVKEVQAVSELRKTVSLEMDSIKKKIAEDPEAAAGLVTSLLTDNFNTRPKIDELFGWQLASVHTKGIKATFKLYNEANRLELELQGLAKLLTDFAPQIKAAGGPALFGVTAKTNGVKLVSIMQPMCGEVPAEGEKPPAEGEGAEGGGDKPAAAPALDSLKPCDDSGAAVGFKVRDTLAGEPVVMLKGFGKDQVTIVVPDQEIYSFAVGLEPNKNALNVLDFQLKRVTEQLERMNSAEKTALKALENYADSPDVDGSNAQSDPDE